MPVSGIATGTRTMDLDTSPRVKRHVSRINDRPQILGNRTCVPKLLLFGASVVSGIADPDYSRPLELVSQESNESNLKT